jgi:hypothetical protein
MKMKIEMTTRRFFSLAIGSLVAGLVLAGSLEPPGPPAPTMVTLQQIYDAVTTTPGQAGSLQPPAGAPAPTMVTLQGIYGAVAGNRFTDQGNGTVKDNGTGLIWLKNASCLGTRTWDAANTAAAQLGQGTAGGIACGLTDGSHPGDWHLPSLGCLDWNNSCYVDQWSNAGGEFTTIFGPACAAGWPLNTAGTGCGTEGNPFSGVQSDLYWSSTTLADGPVLAWLVVLSYGNVLRYGKSMTSYVWPVRGGP